MKKIDVASWDRKSHYEWFSAFADPSVAFDVKMDITELLAWCKSRGVSSFAALMYIVTESINGEEAFRLRVLGEDVVLVDYANVAYTIMVNEDTFVNCRARLNRGFRAYCEDVEANRVKFSDSNYVQDEYNDVSVVNDIYCSCVPWLNFTSVRQPVPDHIPESRSIPRACWGKYVKEGDRTYVTLNITASHALVDGLNMSRVFSAIQAGFDDPQKFVDQREVTPS